jgi:[ribosomal protein S5]-alanine N-acetyltransferase
MERHTERLRTTPIGPAHAEELWRLHQGPGIAACGGTLTRDTARERRAHG